MSTHKAVAVFAIFSLMLGFWLSSCTQMGGQASIVNEYSGAFTEIYGAVPDQMPMTESMIQLKFSYSSQDVKGTGMVTFKKIPKYDTDYVTLDIMNFRFEGKYNGDTKKLSGVAYMTGKITCISNCEGVSDNEYGGNYAWSAQLTEYDQKMLGELKDLGKFTAAKR